MAIEKEFKVTIDVEEVSKAVDNIKEICSYLKKELSI